MAIRRSSSSISPRHSNLIHNRRELKVQHDWKMLLLVIIAILGRLIGAYVGFNYPD